MSVFSKKKKKDKSPGKPAPERSHPYKITLIGLLLWLATTWLFFGNGILSHVNMAKGQRVSSTIVATVDFDCENLKETAFKRTKAAESIPPVFTIDLTQQERIARRISELFDRLEKLTKTPSDRYTDVKGSINDLLLGSPVETQELIDQFPADQIESAKQTVLTNLVRVMSAGILSDESRRTLFRGTARHKLTIANPVNDTRHTEPLYEIYSVNSAARTIAAALPKSGQRELIQRLLASLITENLTYDESATRALRNEAVRRVKPVIQHYLAGTTLARAGDTVTQQTLLLLQQHEKQRLQNQELLEQILELLGNSILLLAGLIIAAIFLRVIKPSILRKPAHILLLATLSFLTLGLTRLCGHLSLQYSIVSPSLLMYLTPYALSVLLAAILLGGRAALCLGLWNSFATAILFDQSFGVFVLGALVAVTATSTARNVHRRTSLFHAGLWVCSVKILFVLISAILNRPLIPVLVGQLAAGALSAMFSAILALLLIPLFEKIFHITTDITLLELSDMGHPLLQKLALQAPGTYHHSLMVASLAQSAAEAIGANALLVRVCAYYHDIGKLAKPEYFTENIQHQENPHDELAPHMSALIIISHVKEGLALARRNKLPTPILEAIEQHHGNGLISFFYHKAQEQQKANDANGRGGDSVLDSDFRYGGAPAVSPEMAILSLADATEAASRSIEKPTPQKIENMVENIFSTKIRDGQLDYAQLTLAQIHTIKESFKKSLSSMLHGRIPYPKTDENRDLQSSVESTSSASRSEVA